MHGAVSGRFLAASSEGFTASYTEDTALPQQYTLLYNPHNIAQLKLLRSLLFELQKYLNKMKKSLKILPAFTWDSKTRGNQFMPVK
jgi:hypothetical protein